MAQETPIIFERADITVQPAPPVARPGEVTILRDPTAFNIEVRSEDALKLEYIHTLNTLADNGGVMILFNSPSMVTLPAMQVFTPVDALFVADNGTIMQILPNVVLGQQTQDVMAPEPIRAFLFLKAGSVAAHVIQPHDVIAGNMFTPSPAVMQ
jgi:uncharacterized membrane protein (UPF0127 family)